MRTDGVEARGGRSEWRELPARALVWAGLVAVFLALCGWTGLFGGARVEASTQTVFLAGGTVLMALVWSVWPVSWSFRRGAVLVLVTGLVARALLLPHPASDDVNRYLWEGKLVRAGEVPYAAPAADARFAAHHEDRWYPGVNHKERLTAYPPLALLVFAGAGLVDEAVWPLKALFVGADLAVLVMLLLLLQARGAGPSLAVFYALNPLVLLMFAGEAHFDSLMLAPMVGALWLHQRGRSGWAWVCWALAVQVKLIAVLLGCVLARRGGWRRAAAALPVLLVPALPFLGELDGLARGLAGFGGASAHNGSVHAVLRWALGETQAASLTVVGLLAVWALVVLFRIRDPWRAAFALTGALVVLSPIVHPWYLAWVAPFFVLAPSPAWLWAFAAGGLYYTAWASANAGGAWAQPLWAHWLTWAPFAGVLAWETRHALPRLWRPIAGPGRGDKAEAGADGALSVVIPTLDEEANIAGCIQSVMTDEAPPEEVIVVDAGSGDRTVVLAREAGARVLEAGGGRGGQVAAGVAAARGEAVLVLHADARANPGLCARVRRALNSSPEAIGGAAGGRHRTAGAGPGLVLVDALNRLASLFGKMTLGNQAQFFRRRALREVGGYPGLPLMEDVELSLRLQRAGPVLFLTGGVDYSDRRFQREPLGRYLAVAIRLILAYQWARLGGRADTARFYERYYGRAVDGADREGGA